MSVPSFSDVERHALRGGFGADAEAYQRTRPVCPDALFDDLVRMAGLAPGDRVAEIGPGTGQATVPMAERGLAVTAVEIDASQAAVAARRLAAFPAVSVVTSSFEAWEPPGEPFAAVVVISALHWIDPGIRYAKPASVLRPEGTLAVGGCAWARPADADPFWTDVQEDYLAVGFAGEPPSPPDSIPPWHFPAEAGEFFAETASLRYPPVQLTYSAADYLAQLASQAGTRSLGEAKRAEFLARVRDRLASRGAQDLTATFSPFLTVGRRR
jgi:SAM-dependent methyltransferase